MLVGLILKYRENMGGDYDSELVNQSFYQCFKDSSPLSFDTQEEALVKSLEFDWWKQIAKNTFESLDLLDNFSNFDDFFCGVI